MAKQADTDTPYAPPLTLNPALLSQVAGIAEALGRWSARRDALPTPKDVDGVLQQLLSGALVADGITDVFKLETLKTPVPAM